MVTSEYELGVFRDGVDRVYELLPDESEFWNAHAVGRLAASVALVEGPGKATSLVEKGCSKFDISETASFRPWQNLMVAGVAGALEQARRRAGVEGGEELSLRDDFNIGNLQAGHRLVGLVSAGDTAVVPLAREHIKTAQTDPLFVDKYDLLLSIYRAGDSLTVDLALEMADSDRASDRQDPDRKAITNTGLRKLASKMLSEDDTEQLDEVVARIEGERELAMILAEMHASGKYPERLLGMRVVELCRLQEVIGTPQIALALNKMVSAGYGPLVETYRTLFIDESTRRPDNETSPEELVALYEAGLPAARYRLIDIAANSNYLSVLESLLAIGENEFAYQRASELFNISPDRYMLDIMMKAEFSTQDWSLYWDLDQGQFKFFNDCRHVQKLAEHLSGTKLALDGRG